jgi:zinc finger BED domain-containing protein 4
MITRRISEMIALDLQPFSIVEDIGFRRLIHSIAPQYVMPSRKYFSESKIPELYSEVRETLQRAISEQSSLAFTVDIWTCQYTIQSYLGLTCHWLTKDFQRKMAVLLCQPFEDSHTALNIADAWKTMMKDWQLTSENSPKCHVVVSDSAANMIKTFRELMIDRIACFAHTLQLVVKRTVCFRSAQLVTHVLLSGQWLGTSNILPLLQVLSVRNNVN